MKTVETNFTKKLFERNENKENRLSNFQIKGRMKKNEKDEDAIAEERENIIEESPENLNKASICISQKVPQFIVNKINSQLKESNEAITSNHSGPNKEGKFEIKISNKKASFKKNEEISFTLDLNSVRKLNTKTFECSQEETTMKSPGQNMV